MKKLVKGRHEPAIVLMRVLVETTTLPEGWIFNIIEGKYLEEVTKRRGALGQIGANRSNPREL